MKDDFRDTAGLEFSPSKVDSLADLGCDPEGGPAACPPRWSNEEINSCMHTLKRFESEAEVSSFLESRIRSITNPYVFHPSYSIPIEKA